MPKQVNLKRSTAAKRGWETRRKNQAMKAAPVKTIVVEGAEPADLEKPTMKKFFKDKGLNEIYNTGLQFAMVSKDMEQCHPFAFCKDFLQDAIWAELNKKRASIYGFVHEYGVNPPIDLVTTRMAVRFKGKKGFKGMCEKSLTFIREMDKAQNFKPSELLFAGKYPDSPSSVFIFESDQGWMHSPVMISLYSLALRVGMTYEGGGWRKHFESAKNYVGSNDRGYTASAKKALDKIVGKSLGEVFAAKMEKNYPPNVDAGAGLHDYSGIVSFANNQISKNLKAHWK